MRQTLADTERIALDCEAAGYHRYSDRLCLVQLTVGSVTYLLDPFSIAPEAALRTALEDPGIEVLMHGADFDIRLLDRDLGIRVRGLFDTQIAAALVGAEAVGLSALLQSRLGVELSKKYQKADWAQRPLPEPMLEYAAHDTAHLPALSERLRQELMSLGRLEWAREEFRELEKVRFEPPNGEDPVLSLKEARDLEPRQVDRLREALVWRDGIARDLDRALFRVVGDAVLVEAARMDPGTVSHLGDLKGMKRSLARERGEGLLGRFREVNDRAESELVGYPRRPRVPNGYLRRLSSDGESRLSRLKAVRNDRALVLGVDRGTLLPNSVLHQIAESPPVDMAALSEVGGMRLWQAELLADDLLAALSEGCTKTPDRASSN